MSSPALSIVTPSYNQAEFLEKNLQSVSSQATEDVEHIVVDGGSDDGTVNVLRRYEDQYNLKWVSEPDRGQTDALNKGIERAEGDWIGWQNSDDYYLDGAFNHLRTAINRKPNADVVYGDLLIVDEEGNILTRQFMTRPSKFIQRYWSLFASNQSLFVKRAVLEEIGPFDEELEYTMDAELTWRLLDGGYELARVSEPLGAFRVQSDAKTFGDVGQYQQSELASIYDHPWYERVLPRPALEVAAKATKLGFLLRDGRTDAVRYNLENLG